MSIPEILWATVFVLFCTLVAITAATKEKP